MVSCGQAAVGHEGTADMSVEMSVRRTIGMVVRGNRSVLALVARCADVRALPGVHVTDSEPLFVRYRWMTEIRHASHGVILILINNNLYYELEVAQ